MVPTLPPVDGLPAMEMEATLLLSPNNTDPVTLWSNVSANEDVFEYDELNEADE